MSVGNLFIFGAATPGTATAGAAAVEIMDPSEPTEDESIRCSGKEQAVSRLFLASGPGLR